MLCVCGGLELVGPGDLLPRGRAAAYTWHPLLMSYNNRLSTDNEFSHKYNYCFVRDNDVHESIPRTFRTSLPKRIVDGTYN